METPFWRQHLSSITIGLLDVFAIGLGMGVPVFAIALGFPVGWWFASRQLQMHPQAEPELHRAIPASLIRTLLVQSATVTLVTFLLLTVVWGPQLPAAFDPSVQAREWGIPLLLFTSQASKIGWMVLMLLVSPALQFMALVTAGTWKLSRGK